MSTFQRTFPPQGRILFDGGLNNKFERSIIEDNESPSCLNVVFGAGTVETRQGCQKLNTAAIGSFVGDGLYTRTASDGSETMVAYAGGTMYTLAGSTFTSVPSGTSIFTAGVRVGTVQMENYLFMGNGGVIPMKWNGTELTRHGIYPPTVTATVASQATGLLTGQYQYKMTALNSNLVESDVGPVTSTLTAASGTLRLTNLQTFAASFGVGSRRLYRTTAGGTSFKRVATIADNTTTTYDDNIADLSLGADAPLDNGVPPKYKVAVYHAERLFFIDPTTNNVMYTELGNPYTVKSTNFINTGDNTFEPPQTLSIYNNALLIGTNRSPLIVYMPTTDPADWTPPQRLQVAFGSRSPFGVISYKDKTLMPAIDQSGKFVGFAAIKGNAVDPASTLLTFSATGSEMKSDRIEPDMFLLQESFASNISSVNYKNKLFISATYGAAQTTNNRIYVMDYSIMDLTKRQRESWSPWDNLNAAQFTVYGGKLYYISSTATGFVYQLETGIYNDDGSAINSYYWTKEFSGHDSEINYTKDFRFANFLIELTGAYNMDINYRVDSDIGDGAVERVNLDSGGSNWGTLIWGVGTWGGGSKQRDHRVYLNGVRGTRIQFRFSNQNVINQRFKVHWGMFRYNLKGYR